MKIKFSKESENISLRTLLNDLGLLRNELYLVTCQIKMLSREEP